MSVASRSSTVCLTNEQTEYYYHNNNNKQYSIRVFTVEIHLLHLGLVQHRLGQQQSCRLGDLSKGQVQLLQTRRRVLQQTHHDDIAHITTDRGTG